MTMLIPKLTISLILLISSTNIFAINRIHAPAHNELKMVDTGHEDSKDLQRKTFKNQYQAYSRSRNHH